MDAHGENYEFIDRDLVCDLGSKVCDWVRYQDEYYAP